MNISGLAAPFPKSAIHWRAQSLTKDATKALALAYLDARDVQDRLDAVCGAENWQCEYSETATGRVICRIGIRFGDEWVWKSDGAGSTAVEGEKGGISDAFKRAAVPWGIGRYLYRVKAPWVPCKTYERGGKRFFSDWAEDPWKHVSGVPFGEQSGPVAADPEPEPQFDHKAATDRIKKRLNGCKTLDDLRDAFIAETHTINEIGEIEQALKAQIINLKDKIKSDIQSGA